MSETFVKIASTRIKKSNIKSFGVGSQSKGGQGLFSAIDSWASGDGFWKGYAGSRTERYLYITTYQNDNFKFTDSEINFEETIRMLESI